MAKLKKPSHSIMCPCGSNKTFIECCSRYLDNNEFAPNAELLMRSRYTAFALQREEYLLATWHQTTRPPTLGLSEELPAQWIGLVVKNFEQTDADHAVVEFIARYKVNGRAHKLQEISYFIREQGKWFYVDGDMD